VNGYETRLVQKRSLRLVELDHFSSSRWESVTNQQLLGVRFYHRKSGPQGPPGSSKSPRNDENDPWKAHGIRFKNHRIPKSISSWMDIGHGIRSIYTYDKYVMIQAVWYNNNDIE
jgi:hypothetical protein